MAPRPRLRLVLATAALAVVGAAGPAAGAIRMDDAVLVTESVAAPSLTPVAAEASCPDGYVVVSGGAFWEVDEERFDPALATNRKLVASLPTGGGTRWFAAGDNDAEPALFIVVAWCLPPGQVGDYVGRKRALAAAQFPSGTVRCPDGHRAVTGGAALREREPLGPALGDHGVLSSLQMTSDGRGWQASALRNSDSQARLRLVVLCRPERAVGAYSRSSRAHKSGQTRGGTTACAEDRFVVGGGASWVDGSGVPRGILGGIASSGPLEDGSGWYASGRRRTSTAEAFKVSAMCRP